jgi:hypothetical protein
MQSLFNPEKPKEPGKFSLLMNKLMTPENLVQPAAEAALLTGITEAVTRAPMRPAEIFLALVAPPIAHLVAQAGIEIWKDHKAGHSVTVKVPSVDAAQTGQNVTVAPAAITASIGAPLKPAAAAVQAESAKAKGGVATNVQAEERRPPIANPGQKRKGPSSKAQAKRNKAQAHHR